MSKKTDAKTAAEEKAPVMKTEGASADAPKAQAAKKKKKPAKKPDNRSTLTKVRAFIPAIVVVVCAIAFIAKVPLGNISSFGWEAISTICPVGSLSVLLASKTFIPRVLVSLIIAAVFILLFGRAFCSWVCTVPLVQRTLNIRSLSKHDQRQQKHERERKAKRRATSKKGAAKNADDASAAADEVTQVAAQGSVAVACAETEAAAAQSVSEVVEAVAEDAVAPVEGAVEGSLSKAERSEVAKEFAKVAGAKGCASHRAHVFDSRHIILGGSLLSAAIFGFPVFCLVCPIGLAFASVYLVLRLFTGQVSLALIIVPLMLVAELLLFKKWCYKVCPLGALMSLASLGNKTFVPHVNPEKCIETTTGKKCGRCEDVCPQGINLADVAAGQHTLNDCTKCRSCVDACPSKAISMPFLPPKKAVEKIEGEVKRA